MIQTEKNRENYREFMAALDLDEVDLDVSVDREDHCAIYSEKSKTYAEEILTARISWGKGIAGEPDQVLTWYDDVDIKEMSIKGMKSETCDHIVVSNLTEASLRAMRQDGIATATVMETGEEKFQAVIKTAKAKTLEEQQKLDEMRKTLNERYGNGLEYPKVAVPGMPYDREQSRVCRTVSINAAAPVQGISRLQERIHEKDGVYTREEGQARAFAAEHGLSKTDQLIASIEEKIQRYGLKDHEEGQKVGYGEQKSKPIFNEEEPKKKEEQQQKQPEQEQTGRYEFGMGGGFLATILKLIKDLILMIINGARHAMQKMQEEKQVKEPWGDKRPYPDNELAKGTILERGGFSKSQEQEKGRSVRDIVKQAGRAAREQEAQQQAEAAQKRPGMMATPTRDIDEATLSR